MRRSTPSTTHGPALDAPRSPRSGTAWCTAAPLFSAPTLVDDDVLAAVEDLVPLAPLHNPANLDGIAVARRLFPDVPQVAVFDTAFHQTMPPAAYTYAVPRDWREEHRIRRYGFHGTSHAYVSRAAAALLLAPVDETNLIVLHLGNGASATAVHGGRSVDTSMGLTPLEGLVMGTRSGDVDPALHAHLHRHLGWSIDEIDACPQPRVGPEGPRRPQRLPRGDDAARVTATRPRRWRSRSTPTGSASTSAPTTPSSARSTAIVFTGGVGQHSPELRSAVALRPGAARHRARPRPQRPARPRPHRRLAPTAADVPVLVVPTNEEWEIARQALAVVRGS